MNRNVLFNSKVLPGGRSLCGAGSTRGSSTWPFPGSHGGFVLIKNLSPHWRGKAATSSCKRKSSTEQGRKKIPPSFGKVGEQRAEKADEDERCHRQEGRSEQRKCRREARGERERDQESNILPPDSVSVSFHNKASGGRSRSHFFRLGNSGKMKHLVHSHAVCNPTKI